MTIASTGNSQAVQGIDHPDSQLLLPGANIEFTAALTHQVTQQCHVRRLSGVVDMVLGPAYPSANPSAVGTMVIPIKIRSVKYPVRVSKDYNPLDSALLELRLDAHDDDFEAGQRNCWRLVLMGSPSAAAAATASAEPAAAGAAPTQPGAVESIGRAPAAVATTAAEAPPSSASVATPTPAAVLQVNTDPKQAASPGQTQPATSAVAADAKGVLAKVPKPELTGTALLQPGPARESSVEHGKQQQQQQERGSRKRLLEAVTLPDAGQDHSTLQPAGPAAAGMQDSKPVQQTAAGAMQPSSVVPAAAGSRPQRAAGVALNQGLAQAAGQEAADVQDDGMECDEPALGLLADPTGNSSDSTNPTAVVAAGESTHVQDKSMRLL